MDGHSACQDCDRNQRHPRSRVAQRLYDFDRAVTDVSQRQFSALSQTPRSTLRFWIKRRERLDLDPELARFLESPVGLEFVHGIVVAAHLVFEADGGCGLRSLSRFLELSRLDRVVASSYGAQQAYAQTIQHGIVAYGREQREQLGPQMAPRDITVCEDETFHPETCLVAIEPVSGMILLETYRDGRDAETWNHALKEALADLPVTVVQSVSDEAGGLKSHAHALGAHHSPDLFHVQQELSRATSASLAGEVRRRENAAAGALQTARDKADERDACLQECPDSDAVDDLTNETVGAVKSARLARDLARAALTRQRDAVAARRGLSDDDHPFDLTSGSVRTAEDVDRGLRARLDIVASVADQAGLSAAARSRIEKARRVLPGLVATVAFFWTWVWERIGKLSLSEAVQRSLIEEQLAGEYLSLASRKAGTAAQRRALRELSDRLLSHARDGPLSELPAIERESLQAECRGWAELFQRSSSCVEGRNGQLSLSHHSLHRLQGERLASLTVLANHFHRRPDGTTAAERFYGAGSTDLFDWLIQRVPILPRPGKASRA
jgi:hypothetical protein